jgi:hypothetical protein
MICPHSINFENVWVKSGSFVYDKLQEIVRCRFARQELKFAIDGSRPCENNAAANLLKRKCSFYFLGSKNEMTNKDSS